MLAAEQFQDFELVGIIKETGVDDSGLVDFQQTYFPYPLYCDKSYQFYEALGYRKVGFSIDLTVVLSVICETYKRIRSKKIDGNLKGEGVVQGGVIFFNAKGNPVYAYEEQTGKDLPVKDIVAAANQMRKKATG